MDSRLVDDFACFSSVGKKHFMCLWCKPVYPIPHNVCGINGFTRVQICPIPFFPLTETSKGVFDWTCSGIRILIND